MIFWNEDFDEITGWDGYRRAVILCILITMVCFTNLYMGRGNLWGGKGPYVQVFSNSIIVLYSFSLISLILLATYCQKVQDPPRAYTRRLWFNLQFILFNIPNLIPTSGKQGRAERNRKSSKTKDNKKDNVSLVTFYPQRYYQDK